RLPPFARRLQSGGRGRRAADQKAARPAAAPAPSGADTRWNGRFQRQRGLGEAGSALDRKDKAQRVPITHVRENSRKGFLLSCKHHWQNPNELAGGRTPTLTDIEDRPGPLL